MGYRVLLIAEAANPEWVSVPLVGWSIFAAIRDEIVADGGEVHLVTQVRNRDALQRAGLREGEDFTAIDTEFIARPVYRLSQVLRMGEGRGWTMVQAVNALAYPWFERKVWALFGPQIKAGRFDVVHRVTPLSPTIPSPMSRRCRAAGVPFVLGPLNGGVPWPKGFDQARRREREWLSYFRGLNHLRPSVRRTMADSASILVGSRHTESEVPQEQRSKTVYLPENAVDPTWILPRAEARRADGPLLIAFVGRLVPYKGADMLLEACAPFIRQGRVRVDLVGDGPMRADLEQQVRDLGLPSVEPNLNTAPLAGVAFHGWLERRRVKEVLIGADLLGFPSIREFGGGVVLEAMAMGIPPLIVDYAGPGELVDAHTGFKVPIGTRASIIRNLGEAVERILADRACLVRTGEAAAARVARDFTWQAKARAVRAVYDSVCGPVQSGR